MGAAERNERRRRMWRWLVTRFDAGRLVFVDETGATIALIRLYGRAPRNERCYGTAPRNYGKNLTLVAALTLDGITAPMLLDGALDGAAFECYVRHVLMPTLHPGQIVILDNLAVHKREMLRGALREVGCRALFLPAYSPDLNPIELAYSTVKAYLRRVGARTREALEVAITEAIDRVTPAQATAYFRHCGYQRTAQ